MRKIGALLWIALATVLCMEANYYYWLALSDAPVLAGELTEEWQECILGLVISGMMAVTGIYKRDWLGEETGGTLFFGRRWRDPPRHCGYPPVLRGGTAGFFLGGRVGSLVCAVRRCDGSSRP